MYKTDNYINTELSTKIYKNNKNYRYSVLTYSNQSILSERHDTRLHFYAHMRANHYDFLFWLSSYMARQRLYRSVYFCILPNKVVPSHCKSKREITFNLVTVVGDYHVVHDTEDFAWLLINTAHLLKVSVYECVMLMLSIPSKVVMFFIANVLLKSLLSHALMD